MLALGALVVISLLAARYRRGRANPFHDPNPPAEESADMVEEDDIFAPPVHYDPSVAHPPPVPDADLPRREPSVQP